VLDLHEGHEEHLPHGHLADWQEAEVAQVVREVHYDRVLLGEFGFLATDEDQIVDLGLREKLLHFEDLLLAVHIEGHGEDSKLALVVDWWLRLGGLLLGGGGI